MKLGVGDALETNDASVIAWHFCDFGENKYY